MKSYTDIEQSKKLVKILPIESADMFWYRDAVTTETSPRIMNYKKVPKLQSMYYSPCWSLAALLNILPSTTLDTSNDHYCRFRCQQKCTEWHDNPIDACYEMIVKLHELNFL